MPWRRSRQPSAVFLPGESRGLVWQATVHRVAWTWLSDRHFHFPGSSWDLDARKAQESKELQPRPWGRSCWTQELNCQLFRSHAKIAKAYFMTLDKCNCLQFRGEERKCLLSLGVCPLYFCSGVACLHVLRLWGERCFLFSRRAPPSHHRLFHCGCYVLPSALVKVPGFWK